MSAEGVHDPHIQRPTSTVGPRPYRSHKIPACDFCRNRKSRCTRDISDQPCLTCRMHDVECTTVKKNQPKIDEGSKSDPKQRRATKLKRREWLLSPVDASPVLVVSEIERSHGMDKLSRPEPVAQAVGNNDPGDAEPPGNLTQATHIVGPVMARDAQVLEQYMSPVYASTVSHVRPNPYSVYSDDPINPVVYMRVPRQRGLPPLGNGTPGFKQCENMQKILDPLGNTLFSLYFDMVHPAFPILDEKTVVEAYRQDGLPHALVCEIYAVSLIFWKTSKTILSTGRPPPDFAYMWNITVSALQEDFLSPSFSTVLACILDLLGRPTTSITYNSLNVGRAVALAQSLGLNRNPSNWNLSHRQKSLRIRTWWALVIHDTWASLSHGTPMHTQSSQWDTPLPDIDSLCLGPTENNRLHSDVHLKGARCFIALCELTRILGDILSLIYTLRRQTQGTCFKSLRRNETSLDEWEDSLPRWLGPSNSEFQKMAPGALNLQLSCLTVKMCICRVGLQETARSEEPDDTEARHYYQSRCRNAARTVIDFVTSLQPCDMDVFWLPYSAYHFTSATTLILRCALEAESDERARSCVASAKALIDYLRRAKVEANWDLGDICLNQCEAVVKQMCDGGYLDFRKRISKTTAARGRADASRRSGPTQPRALPPEYPKDQQADQPVTSDECAEIRVSSEGLGDGNELAEAGVYSGFDMVAALSNDTDMLLSSPLFPDLWQMAHLDGFGAYTTF